MTNEALEKAKKTFENVRFEKEELSKPYTGPQSVREAEELERKREEEARKRKFPALYPEGHPVRTKFEEKEKSAKS